MSEHSRSENPRVGGSIPSQATNLQALAAAGRPEDTPNPKSGQRARTPQDGRAGVWSMVRLACLALLVVAASLAPSVPAQAASKKAEPQAVQGQQYQYPGPHNCKLFPNGKLCKLYCKVFPGTDLCPNPPAKK